MSEMIERVAKAMAVADGFKSLDDAMQAFGGENSCDYRKCACAAIEAMRNAEFQVRDETGVIHELRGAPMDTWRFLIDASLK